MKKRCALAAHFDGLHYGETGCYWTDASTPKGCVWFLADSREQAVVVPQRFIFA